MSAYLHNYSHHSLRIIILQTWFRTHISCITCISSLIWISHMVNLQIPFGGIGQSEHSQKLAHALWQCHRSESPPALPPLSASPHKDNTLQQWTQWLHSPVPTVARLVNIVTNWLWNDVDSCTAQIDIHTSHAKASFPAVFLWRMIRISEKWQEKSLQTVNASHDFISPRHLSHFFKCHHQSLSCYDVARPPWICL